MRILLLSDIHANAVALSAVIRFAKDKFDEAWCLGDIVGYGPRPNECVDIIQDLCSLSVMGNHDHAGIFEIPDAFNPWAKMALRWTQEELTACSRSYLEQLSQNPLHPIDEQSMLLTHGSPREPLDEYIMTPSLALENFALFEDRICLVGHTHVPTIYRLQLHHRGTNMGKFASEDRLGEKNETDFSKNMIATVDRLQLVENARIQLEPSGNNRVIINPGSVGQPRDNDTRASFAILDLEQCVLQYFRIPYDIRATQKQMDDAQLPRKLIERLALGR